MVHMRHLLLGMLGLGASPCQGFENMNGEYLVSKTPHAPAAPYNTKWSEYPEGVEYFEVYVGPITSLYSQVWWTDLPAVQLPRELQARFNNSAMAIVGYEVDQVRRKGDKDFDGSVLKEDVSVPISASYNHHHDAYFTGKGSRMEKVPYDAQDKSVSPMERGDPDFRHVSVEHTPSPRGLPTHQHLASGNGGEYRKSYHGLPSPVAWVIDQPTSVTVVPMSIDTWNRAEMDIGANAKTKFVPGPAPKNSLAPRGKGALYSGLLECPLTSRVRKNIADASSAFGAAQGNFTYMPTNETRSWTSSCKPDPRESILEQHNPTCDLRSYVGGLQVCKHMWSLLDAEQDIPWPTQPLVYYQKYRFYYQEYKPAFHISSVPRDTINWGIGANGAEYDVPQCAPGTPVAECKHEIWGVIDLANNETRGGVIDDLHFAAISMHCHAPTCLAIEIWNNKTGELICRQEPVYGGTGKIDLAKFDEPGYILQPPCLWGAQPGLEPMPFASGGRFLIKAITNNTYGHHGEMAFPEVTLAPWQNTSAFAPRR